VISKGLTQWIECAAPGEPNLKILAVLKAPEQKPSWGAHMEIILILGILGFVFAATTTGRLVYEHETDVLHGPFIEGRQRTRVFGATLVFARAVAEAFMEHLNWKARNVVYLASLA
jgi:hypothetical protein